MIPRIRIAPSTASERLADCTASATQASVALTELATQARRLRECVEVSREKGAANLSQLLRQLGEGLANAQKMYDEANAVDERLEGRLAEWLNARRDHDSRAQRTEANLTSAFTTMTTQVVDGLEKLAVGLGRLYHLGGQRREALSRWVNQSAELFQQLARQQDALQSGMKVLAGHLNGEAELLTERQAQHERRAGLAPGVSSRNAPAKTTAAAGRERPATKAGNGSQGSKGSTPAAGANLPDGSPLPAALMDWLRPGNGASKPPTRRGA